MPNYRVSWMEKIERDVLASDEQDAIEVAKEDRAYIHRRVADIVTEPTVRDISPKLYRVTRSEIWYYDIYAIDEEDAVKKVEAKEESYRCHEGDRTTLGVVETSRDA